MKSLFTKIIALSLVFVFVFSFAACKKTAETGATTAAAITGTGETTEPGTGDTTASDTTVPDGTSTTGTAIPGETTTGGQQGTTKPAAAIVAPVGGTKAQIVAFYNQYANATKEYMGKINVQRNMGTKTTITKFGISFLKGALQGVLDKQLKDKYENKTFVNCKNPADSNDTLQKFLPRGGGEKMSVLEPAGVKRAACVVDGTGWKVTIVLIKEIATLDKPPKYHTSVMDKLQIDNDSLGDFTLGDGKVTYGQINSPYDGATLVAKFNSKGYLDHLRMDAPLQISGKLGYKNIGNIETVIDGSFWGDMTFKYY